MHDINCCDFLSFRKSIFVTLWMFNKASFETSVFNFLRSDDLNHVLANVEKHLQYIKCSVGYLTKSLRGASDPAIVVQVWLTFWNTEITTTNIDFPEVRILPEIFIEFKKFSTWNIYWVQVLPNIYSCVATSECTIDSEIRENRLKKPLIFQFRSWLGQKYANSRPFEQCLTNWFTEHV